MKTASRARTLMLTAGVFVFFFAGCRVGPDYVRPSAPLAPAFKEPGPGNFESEGGWGTAHPADAQLKGDWWTLFNDPALNQLEEQVDSANQSLKQAEAHFQASRAAVRFNRASEAPTIGANPTIGVVRDSSNQPYFNKAAATGGSGSFELPIDLNYEVDLWGRIRRTVTQSREQAQSSAADLENARLSLHAELAIDYFNLRCDSMFIRGPLNIDISGLHLRCLKLSARLRNVRLGRGAAVVAILRELKRGLKRFHCVCEQPALGIG